MGEWRGSFGFTGKYIKCDGKIQKDRGKGRDSKGFMAARLGRKKIFFEPFPIMVELVARSDIL